MEESKKRIKLCARNSPPHDPHSGVVLVRGSARTHARAPPLHSALSSSRAAAERHGAPAAAAAHDPPQRRTGRRHVLLQRRRAHGLAARLSLRPGALRARHRPRPRGDQREVPLSPRRASAESPREVRADADVRETNSCCISPY